MGEKIGVKEKLKNICTVGNAVKFIFTAFLLVSFLKIWLSEKSFTSLSFAAESSLVSWTVFVAFLTLVMAALEFFFEKIRLVEWIMLGGALLFSLALVIKHGKENQYQLYAAILVVFAVILNYNVKVGTFSVVPKSFDKRIKWGLVALFALVACAVVAGIGVYRYVSYSAPNFDFGIWCNMFYNMKESGLPVTTCERDLLLSHFAVHFSPIYYLMLPFYFIFPSPITLQVLQAVILYSGIVPLCIMAKDKGLSDRATVLLGLVYSFYPAIATGTFYDLHENCFLVPLLLWCFCFFEKEKYIPMAVFAALTQLVKEDAFIYLLVFSVYIFFLKKKKKIALVLAASALAYFAVVAGLMSAFGNGIMVNRYDNLIADSNDGLLGVIKTALLNPGYILTQMFVSKDGDNAKILYAFQLFVPLAIIPFATKKIFRYILVVPVLMNLITMYVYQPNIRFQYSFGITAFLFYVVMLNLSELGEKPTEFMLPLSAVASVLLFAMLAGANLGYYVNRYENEKESYKHADYVLAEILPKDASVACSTFLLPHIADRDEIYEITYHKENGGYKTDFEYAVIDTRYADDCKKFTEYFLENGYEEYHNDGGYVLILKKK